jgi:four helix bundle protein
MRRYSDLQVWKRSHAVVLEIYRATSRFPVAERFGLTAQLRRAAVSVPTNIAEGSKRISQRDFAHFLNISEGSLAEVHYLIELARDLGYLEQSLAATLLDEIEEILRMLAVLRKKVEAAQ